MKHRDLLEDFRRAGKEEMMSCVYGEKIYTGNSVVDNAYLVFNRQKIVGISKRKGAHLIGKFPVLTPAFIDPHSHIGMVRAGEPQAESEANDQLDTILALSDALDSVQMDDPAFREAVEMGVLYSCVVPGSANILGGRSAVIRNYAKNSTEALIARAGVKAAFGYNPMSKHSWKGTRPSTRMGAVAVLKKRFDEVLQKMEKRRKAKGKKKDEVTFSAEEAVLQEVLTGKTLLRVHVHKIDDIAVLLRLADEYKFRVSVEHAMDVDQPEIFLELEKRRIAVTYGPVDAFAYKVELKHKKWQNVRHLLDSKVEFGLMTDHPVVPAHQLFLQTRWFTRAGLSKQEAVEIVSRRNAEILGIDRMLGTLEKGKWASFVCWNGDPFDLTRYPAAVYGEGKLQ
jgi:imidazolonepropionase-like amidohydrolase